MSKIALDLAEFKHKGSDDKSTTLQHKNGHILKLMHTSLSPEHKKQLEHLAKCSGGKMADGGDVTETPNLEAPNTSMTVPQAAREEQQKAMKKDAEWKKPTESDTIKRGEVRHFAEGDLVTTTSAPNMSVDPNAPQVPPPEVPEPPKVDDALAEKRQMYNSFMADQSSGGRFRASAQDPAPKMFGPNGEAPAAFDAKAWDYISNQFERAQQEKLSQSTAAANSAVDENASRQAAGLPPIPVPTVPGSLPQANPQAAQPMAQPTQEPVPQAQDATADYAGMLKSGFNKEMQGISETAKAQGALGEAQAGIYNTKAQNDQVAVDNFKQQYQALDKERNDIISDIKEGYISPDKYWTGDKDGNGGHSKIMTGIGMILAGFNPTSNPNAATNFLKFQMEQNLNAQARNLGAKESLLSHNLRQFGNLRDAADMTRVQQNDMLIHQLGAAASTAQTPLAKAAALQAQGRLMKETAPMFMQLSMNQAMMKMAQQANGQSNQPGKNPTGAVEAMLPMMRQFAPDRAKEWETRIVPGVGVGVTPVPEAARTQIVASKNVNDLFNKTMAMAQQPIPKNPVEYAKFHNMATTLQQQLIGSIKQAQHDGVYKESEADFLLKQIGKDPSSVFRAVNTIPKIKELQAIKQAEYSNLLNTYGIRGQSLPQAAAAPQYKTVNGVKYMRGPNGQAVPVK